MQPDPFGNKSPRAPIPAPHSWTPGSDAETTDGAPKSNPVSIIPPWRRELLALTLAFSALFGFVLGSRPLANPDEGRYAEIPREMIASGDWITPHLNAIPYFEKPPLVYWLGGLAQKFFGESEWSVRLVPAVFALAGVLLTYAATRRLFGRGAGLGAAIVLGTSILYFALARLLILDMAVSVLMAATLFCFILGVREPAGARRRWFFYGLYASAALATLTKGLMGFLVTGAVMFLWLLIFNQWKRLRPLYLPSGLALFLAIAAPWHVLVALRNPDWVQAYLVREHWQRFTVDLGRQQPWWFFVPIVAVGFFPWTGFLWSAWREALRGGWSRRRENADAWFFATWAAFMFLFYSKSQSKLIPYILPVLPPLAVVTGLWLAQRWARREAPRVHAGVAGFSLGCMILAGALVVAVAQPGLIKDAAQAEALRPFGWSMSAVLLTGAVGVGLLGRRDVRVGLAVMATTMAVFYSLLSVAATDIQRPGTRELALVAKARIQPEDRVYHYWGFFHDFVYYSGRTVGLVDYTDELGAQFLPPAERAARFITTAELRRQWAEPRRVWLVVRKRDAATLSGDAAFRHHMIAENRAHCLLSNQP
ncbi:MAG: glycosyltransferase family 39 protein [Opitutaceae bacterium]|nr:glycosyltransferase family 39 protein [Opitutaceae bacterium]